MEGDFAVEDGKGFCVDKMGGTEELYGAWVGRKEFHCCGRARTRNWDAWEHLYGLVVGVEEDISVDLHTQFCG